jgi:hypothetical protein
LTTELELQGLEYSEENVERLLDMLGDSKTRWYALRRLRGFEAAGLVAGTLWNPDLHPRGPDGKFIEKWGFVRWLVDGIWERGRVENILPDGKIIVNPDKDKGDLVELSTKQAYALPTPKGQIKGTPDPNSHNVPEAWEKVGGQGGSNPGGFYKTKTTVPVRADPTSEMIDQVASEESFSPVDYKDVAEVYKAGGVNQPDLFVGLYTTLSGKRRMIFRTDAEEVDPITWDEAKNSPDLKLWVTTSPFDAEAARLTLTHGMDVEEGTRFYVKQTKSVDHGANEMLANELYKLAGVPVPELYFGDHQTVASKILTASGDVAPQTLSSVKDDPNVLAEIRKNMTVDAWLANWDVAGMTYDNIIVVDGVPYRIDTGGSLQYRAQGGPKGSNFGAEVGELQTLRNQSMNPSSGHVFSGITQGELQDGARRVAAISPRQIKDMVASAGLSPSVADTLIARRQDVIQKLSVPDPYAVYVPPKLTNYGKQTPPDEQFWNPLANEWQAGVIKKTAHTLFQEVNDEIGRLYQQSNSGVAPIAGDYVAAYAIPGEPTAFLRVTEIGDGIITGVSGLEPDNKDTYQLPIGQMRVVEKSDRLDRIYTQYKVAQVNEQLRGHSLNQFFDLALVNEDMPKPLLTLRPYTYQVTGDDLWNLEKDDFVFHDYDDEEGEHQVLYRMNGVSDNAVSMTNVLDGKERILTWNEWVDNYQGSQWHIPDGFTQDETLALLKRDQLLDSEDLVSSVELDVPDEEIDASTDYPESTPYNTSPVADLEALGVAASMTGTTGVNTSISTGEGTLMDDLYQQLFDGFGVDTLADIDLGDLESGGLFDDTALHEWLGQSVVISTPNPKEQIYTNYDRRGIWFIEDVQVEVVKYYSGDRYLKGTIKMRSPSGARLSWVVAEKSDFSGQIMQPVTTIDASIPQTLPQFKANGDIVQEGVVIGNHNKSWSSFQASIFPEYSVSGTSKVINSYKQKDLRKMVGIYSIPQLQPEVVEKSDKTKGSKDAILSVGSLKSRSDFPVGTWVTAPDGWVGKVDEIPSMDLFNRFPGAVKASSDIDGKTRIINANLLVALEEPPATTFIPEPVPSTIAEVGKMVGAPPFHPLKYGDGNDPYLGQYVEARGPGDKVIQGTIVWVGPPEGKQAKIAPLASVQTADGKIIRKTLSKITLLKDVEGAPIATPIPKGLPEDTKASIEIITDFTPEQTSDMAMKYVSADGKTLAQPQWEKDKWLGGSPKRKLSKDGYAPRIGMRMRTNDDKPVVVVAYGDVYKNPNSVRVVSLIDGSEQNRAVSALWVDHQAELGDSETGGLDYVRGITANFNDEYKSTELLPNGTVIYKASSDKNVIVGGEYRPVDRYFFLTEDGRVHELTASGASQSTMSADYTKGFLTRLAQLGNIHKVAVIDDTATNFAAFTDVQENAPSALVVYNPGEFTHEEALSTHFLELTGVQVAGAEHPVPIPKGNLSNHLPKPAEVVDLAEEDLIPDPPVVTGVVGALSDKPSKIPIASVVAAGLEILSQKDESGPGTGTEYAFGDAEFIEDMQVRSQIAKDVGTGTEYVEFHFRMVEDKAEAAADRLLSAGKDIEYGKWEARAEFVRPSELEVGDTLSVRTSSMSEAMKPANGEAPNVRVVAAPVLLGSDSKGTPIYRVTIASPDGTTGAIDVQERSLPSLKVYDWNPAAIASVSTTTQVTLTSKAITAGWQDIGPIGYDYNPVTGTSISMDETGAKLFKGTERMLGAGGAGGVSGKATLGKRLHREFPDGSHVRINAVPSSVSGTSSGGKGSSPGEIRRWNDSGLVTIRVPVQVGEDPDAFQASVSRAMESIGITPEKQAPASDEQIALFALNKVFKTHAEGFKHREAPVKAVSPNDPGVAEMFSRMNKELGQYLGRDVTLHDVELHVFEDGRLQVLLSKDVARAISKRQGNIYYRHGGNFDENKIVEMIAGPNRGVMGGSERFSIGIMVTGQSTRTDMTKGSGNRVYMSARQVDNKRDSGAFVYSADAINRSTEIYTNPSDSYGNRDTSNRFMVTGGAYENMVKNKVESSQLAFFMANSESQRQEILDRLLKKGVTHIGNRPIEDVIVTAMGYSMISDEFQNLGSIFDDAIPIDELVPGAVGAVEGVPVAAAV